jgi:hypothetical protein
MIPSIDKHTETMNNMSANLKRGPKIKRNNKRNAKEVFPISNKPLAVYINHRSFTDN